MRSLLKRRVSLFDRLRPNFLSVPSGCVDGASQRNVVWAASAGTEHEECESKPDRCYWTDGWYVGRRRWLPGTCYYNKGKYILIAGVIADVERRAKPGLSRKGKTVTYLNCRYSTRRPYGK